MFIDSVNLDQLDGVSATAGPGVNDRGNPGSVIDMVHTPGEYVNSPTAGSFSDCTESAFMTIDLGTAYMVSGVTIWHYYGDDRAYCQQRVSLSLSGAFAGEEYVAFDTGEANGPAESADGNAFSFPATVTQFVRHWSGRSTANEGVHFLEIDVYGDPSGVPMLAGGFGSASRPSPDSAAIAAGMVGRFVTVMHIVSSHTFLR